MDVVKVADGRVGLMVAVEGKASEFGSAVAVVVEIQRQVTEFVFVFGVMVDVMAFAEEGEIGKLVPAVDMTDGQFVVEGHSGELVFIVAPIKLVIVEGQTKLCGFIIAMVNCRVSIVQSISGHAVRVSVVKSCRIRGDGGGGGSAAS